jgi:hypothetical protein
MKSKLTEGIMWQTEKFLKDKNGTFFFGTIIKPKTN